MISSLAIAAGGDLPGFGAIGIHDPQRRDVAAGCATENDLTATGRNAGSKIPDGRTAVREANRFSGVRIEPTNLCATARRIWFEIAIEMVDVGTLRLVLPGNY